jgi:hypothetical protein
MPGPMGTLLALGAGDELAVGGGVSGGISRKVGRSALEKVLTGAPVSISTIDFIKERKGSLSVGSLLAWMAEVLAGLPDGKSHCNRVRAVSEMLIRLANWALLMVSGVARPLHTLSCS